MQRNAKNNLFDIAKIHLGRFLGLADSVIRGAIPQENYQVFLGLHLGFVVSKSDDEVTQEILGMTQPLRNFVATCLRLDFVATCLHLG